MHYNNVLLHSALIGQLARRRFIWKTSVKLLCVIHYVCDHSVH